MKITHVASAAMLAGVLAFGVGVPADATPSAAKPVKVTLTATMNHSSTVTWAGNDAQAQNTRSTTWKRTFNRKKYTYYSVSVFSVEEGSKVGCTIKLNGKVIRHKTASGDFASVSCTYTKLG